ncbi:DUF6790 family protein [Legionella jordanis]|uniref:DUF6790 family protein n=1 Tax=Legionella jordanis TaxID=456 RepID=UPI0011C3D8C5|nr:DUF6790 family protein [Legionella jordanis]
MDTVTYFFSNFGLMMLILAILLIMINLLLAKHPSFAEICFRWLSLLALGFTSIYAFGMHAFFPAMTAHQIGWKTSPFQFEVAMANLAFGITAILAFKASFGFRLAMVIGSSCWLWGNALGHVAQMLIHDNYSIGNTGSWFWMDIIVPLLLIFCLFYTDHNVSRNTTRRLEYSH